MDRKKLTCFLLTTVIMSAGLLTSPNQTGASTHFSTITGRTGIGSDKTFQYPTDTHLLTVTSNVAPGQDVRVQTPSGPILNHVPITINVIFAGIPTQLSNSNNLMAYLPSSYTQIDRLRLLYAGTTTAYAEYDITYSFSNAPTSFLQTYIHFLNTTYTSHPSPSWLKKQTANVAEVGAADAEAQIWNNLASSLPGYAVVLLDVLDGTPHFPYYHFYNGSARDPDFHVDPSPVSSNYMIAYGGAHRMMFTDFSAGPEGYTKSFSKSQQPVIPIWKLSLANQTEFNTAEQEMGLSVRYAIEGRFIPSFLYEPTYNSAYLVNATIYSFDTSVTWSHYVNPSQIQQAFAQLQPFSTILPVRVSEVNPQQGDHEFYNIVQSSRYIVTVNGTQYTLYDTTIIQNYILSHLYRYASTTYTSEGQPVKTIPIIVIAGLDFIDATFSGQASNMPNGDFGYVIEIMRHFDIGHYGLTYLSIHEAGHGFGLAHPHDFYDYNNPVTGQTGTALYWVNDFSSTPMTYCCQYATYDKLATDNLDQGLTSFLLNETTIDEALASQEYTSLGYGTIPQSYQMELDQANGNMSLAINAYSSSVLDYYTAAQYALAALAHAQKLALILRQDLLTINYLVTDAQGQALANALVQIESPNGTMTTTIASQTGQVTIQHLPWGQYRYVITFEGNVVGGNTVQEVASTIRTLNSKVFSLSISQLQSEDGKTMILPILLTAPNGTIRTVNPAFSQQQAQNGTWTVTVNYEGLQVYSAGLKLDSSTVVQPILKASSLTFQIENAAGDVLANAYFKLRAANGTTVSLVTDSSGRFNLGIVPDGTYVISNAYWQGVDVTPTESASFSIGGSMSGSSTVPVKLRVYNLSLHVSDMFGLGAGGTIITLLHPNGTIITATADSSGTVVFRNLPTGEYTGSATNLGQTSSFQVSPSQLAAGAPTIPLTLGPTSMVILTGVIGVSVLTTVVFAMKRKATRLSRTTPTVTPPEEAGLIPPPTATPQTVQPFQAPQPLPAPIPVVAAIPTTQVEPPRSLTLAIQFCPMCGTRLYPSAKFCQACGKQL